jgi:hypothetical protein
MKEVEQFMHIGIRVERELYEALQQAIDDEVEETGLKITLSSLFRKLFFDYLKKTGYLPKNFNRRNRRQESDGKEAGDGDKPKSNVTAIGAESKVGANAGNKSGASKGAGKASLF